MTEQQNISPTKLAHVVFRTDRYEEMKHWYETVLQAKVQFSNAMLTFLTYDDEHHRIALLRVEGLADRPAAAAGVDHIAFTYATIADLLHTFKRLKAAGIEPVWTIDHGPTTSMYYADPDGNRVELQVDNFPDEASLNAWFRSGAFARNPIGVNFDADDLLRRFEAGENLETARGAEPGHP
jgi:catechol-2,3-dioxygenase